MTSPHDGSYAAALTEIRRARGRLMVCFFTFPLYIITIYRMLGNGYDITWLMLAYMLLYAVFGIGMSVKTCPRCRGQFYVRHYFLNPFRRTCSHCELAYDDPDATNS